jgi:hypothetical protein
LLDQQRNAVIVFCATWGDFAPTIH